MPLALTIKGSSVSKGSLAALYSFCRSLKNLSSFFTLLGLTIIAFPSYAELNKYSHQDLDIKIGQAIFEKLWVFSPSSTKSSDGLGPLYNARSCQQCHDQSKETRQQLHPSLVIQLSIEPPGLDILSSPSKLRNDLQKNLKEHGFIPEPTYGKQLQTFAYPGAKSEADIDVIYTDRKIYFPDGQSVILATPEYQIKNLAYGEFQAHTKLSARVAPRMNGLGLLDQIPTSAIQALADPEDSDKNTISGKINLVWSPDSKTYEIGKFGWKATKHSLNQQNLAALSIDIGVSSWLFPKPEGDCTEAQRECVKLALSTETHLAESSTAAQQVEASKRMTDLLLAFTQNMNKNAHLSLPNELNSTLKQGQALFNKVGCNGCHQPSFNIPNSTQSDTITTVQISPYTDLLLHDMGQALADNRREFQANGREWRTAPLWGIGYYLKQTQKPHFLHDGRARSVLEAILWHEGEAEISQQAFMNLDKDQRSKLIEFVESR